MFSRKKVEKKAVVPYELKEGIIKETLDYVAQLTIDGYLPLDAELAINHEEETLSFGLNNGRLGFEIKKEGEIVGSLTRSKTRFDGIRYFVSGGLFGEGNGSITRELFPDFNPLDVLDKIQDIYSETQEYSQTFTPEHIKTFFGVE